jgi:F-type H+-transporting ATPase subunit gamma
METLEQLRRQLDTTDDLGGIVRTMKALAAVSLRQYDEAVRSLAGYARTIELGLQVVLHDLPAPDGARPAAPEASADTEPDATHRRHAARRIGVVVFGSDHGLCGRFNENIVEHARERLAERSAGAELRWLAVGARAGSLLEHAGQPLDETVFAPGSAERITATVRHVLLKIDAWQRRGGVERVYLFHQRPTAAGERHRPGGARLLPVSLARFHRVQAQRWPGPTLPAYRMDRTRLFSALLKQHFFVSVFRACAESLAAENASRLAAMQAAEKNLSERRTELLAEFRRMRQDAITSELLDVVAGYEALRHGPRA